MFPTLGIVAKKLFPTRQRRGGQGQRIFTFRPGGVGLGDATMGKGEKGGLRARVFSPQKQKGSSSSAAASFKPAERPASSRFAPTCAPPTLRVAEKGETRGPGPSSRDSAFPQAQLQNLYGKFLIIAAAVYFLPFFRFSPCPTGSH